MGRRIRLRDNESGIVELTSRCVHGRYLLRPSWEVNERVLGIIGRAQRMTGIRLHGFIYMSNHSHTLAGTDSVQQMAKYKQFVNGNIAREIGRLHGWREKFWGRRYHSASLADDPVDQEQRFRYILANGCKEGLVDSPLHWPGVSTAWALSNGIWTMKGTWIDRSSDPKRPRRIEETVQLSPLPFMADWSAREQRQWFQDAVRDIEEKTREQRRKDRTRSLGVTRVLKQKPHDKPKKFEPTAGPLFHATSKAELRKLMFNREAKEARYRDAANRLKAGETEIDFPEDCFPPPYVTKKRGPP